MMILFDHYATIRFRMQHIVSIRNRLFLIAEVRYAFL